ncbi:hypothetical protein GCM10010216_38070 [Streptomyces flaveolus]|nr:hypothetical protein GCM10010216_38070 [Streptomyces flaveolus]
MGNGDVAQLQGLEEGAHGGCSICRGAGNASYGNPRSTADVKLRQSSYNGEPPSRIAPERWDLPDELEPP